MNRQRLAEAVYQRVIDKLAERGIVEALASALSPSLIESAQGLAGYMSLGADDRAYVDERGQLVLESVGSSSSEAVRRLSMVIRQLHRGAEDLGVKLVPDLRPAAYRSDEHGWIAVATFKDGHFTEAQAETPERGLEALGTIARDFVGHNAGTYAYLSMEQALQLAALAALEGYRDWRDVQDDLDMFRSRSDWQRHTATGRPIDKHTFQQAIHVAKKYGLRPDMHLSDLLKKFDAQARRGGEAVGDRPDPDWTPGSDPWFTARTDLVQAVERALSWLRMKRYSKAYSVFDEAKRIISTELKLSYTSPVMLAVIEAQKAAMTQNPTTATSACQKALAQVRALPNKREARAQEQYGRFYVLQWKQNMDGWVGRAKANRLFRAQVVKSGGHGYLAIVHSPKGKQQLGPFDTDQAAMSAAQEELDRQVMVANEAVSERPFRHTESTQLRMSPQGLNSFGTGASPRPRRSEAGLTWQGKGPTSGGSVQYEARYGDWRFFLVPSKDGRTYSAIAQAPDGRKPYLGGGLTLDRAKAVVSQFVDNGMSAPKYTIYER